MKKWNLITFQFDIDATDEVGDNELPVHSVRVVLLKRRKLCKHKRHTVAPSQRAPACQQLPAMWIRVDVQVRCLTVGCLSTHAVRANHVS